MQMNQIRIEQTQLELDRLTESFKTWFRRRHAEDRNEADEYIGQYKTQLEAIEKVLQDAVIALHGRLVALNPQREPGEIYDQCRDTDEAIIWVRRVWEYFQEKFDQRDDAQRLGPLLKAADEVVWSCYNRVFVQAKLLEPGLKKSPAPLAYIEPQYSPAALQSSKPLPPDLRLSPEVNFLNDFIKTLPVPVLRLPPWCVDAPWWLIYVGHEVGHHVQHDLKLVGYFREGMEETARAERLSAEEVHSWGRWSEEIFADVFSVMTLGSWAVWAVAEVERSPAPQMVERKTFYPSPIIRLALMAEIARSSGMDVTTALRGIDARALINSDAAAQRDLRVVPEAVKFALGDMCDGLGKLAALCGLGGDAEKIAQSVVAKNLKITNWSRHLRGQEQIAPERKLTTAGEIASASVASWFEVASITDAGARAQAREALSVSTKKTMRENAPPGVRAAAKHALSGKGEELASRLLSITQQRRAQGEPQGGSGADAIRH